jgi:Uma2 family endonuclease
VATPTGLMTFADFERLEDDPQGFRQELRHGELVRVAPPKHKHHLVQHRLRRLLECAADDAGEITNEFGFRGLPEYEYRIADVAFVSKTRWDRISPEGNLEGAPDIVIEVLSPSNSAAEMLDTEQLCLGNGSHEFWLVDPDRRQVRISTPDGRAVTYKSGQQIPLLFGGSLNTDAIFG